MDEYTREEQIELLTLARETITHYLEAGEKLSRDTDNPNFQEKRGVFVTLHKSGSLRGCIGYPLPVKTLYQSIIDNAISSATEDPRFPMVTEKEIQNLDIEISILTVPREVGGIDEVQVGRDGIIISRGFNKGLLLPQVPVEQGWNLEEYISYGCQKAGLPHDEWKKEGVTIETFQAIVFGEKKLLGGQE